MRGKLPIKNMFRLFSKTKKNEGQVLVITVVVMGTLVAFILFAINVADIVRTKIHLQNVADAAATSA